MGDGFSTLCSTLPIPRDVAAVGVAAVAPAAAQTDAANLGEPDAALRDDEEDGRDVDAKSGGVTP